MSFTNPTALFWAILAVPIVALYLLKVRLRRVPVATTMFWDQRFEETRPQAIWRQLRNVLSLLLQLLFLCLLVFAIGDPVLTSSLQKQRRVVVVVDNSASMQAVDTDGRRRLDVATTQVRQVIASLKNQEDMAIVLAGGRAAVACGLTQHPTTLLDAVHKIPSTDGPARLTNALSTARRLLADHANGQIVVVTDAVQPVPAMGDVLWSRIGNSTGNVAITEFQARRSPIDPLAYDILMEVCNFNDQSVSVTLDLQLNETLLDVVPLVLSAGESRRTVTTKTSMAGGVLKATIAATLPDGSPAVDSLLTDNVAQAILPAQRRVAVTLVTDGNWFLQHVLQANALIDLTVATEIPESRPADSVLVLHRKVPDQIPGGRVFVVDPAADTDLWELGEPLSRPLVDKQLTDSRLLQFVQLDSAVLTEARGLRPTGVHEKLVQAFSEDPLYVRFPRPGGDVLVLTVNLDGGDFPLRTAFPILFSNALTWFSGDAKQFVPAVKTGVRTRLPLPMNLAAVDGVMEPLELVSPSAKVQSLKHQSRTVVLPELQESGIWQLRRKTAAGAQGRSGSLRIACNICSRTESDLRRDGDLQHTDIVLAGYPGPPMWLSAVALALVLIVVEWLLFQRRVIG